MKRVKCPFCEYDVAVLIDVTKATERVIEHAREKHPEKGIWSPCPGVVLDMYDGDATAAESLKLGLQYGLDPNELRRNLPEAPSNKLQSLMLTVSVREDNRAVAYNLLGATGHDLLLAGFDFSISANEYDPDAPLPPLPEDLRHDDLTMSRVRDIIMNALMDTGEIQKPSRTANDIIAELQNAGILFRERP